MRDKRVPGSGTLLAAAGLSALLAACGGGGGGGGTVASGSESISGTVAVGAPVAGAAVTVLDRNGTTVGTATTGSDGTYSVSFSSGQYAGPFTIKAVGAVGDTATELVAAVASSGTANVTPLTHAMAAYLAPSGNPSDLVDDATARASVTSAALAAAEAAYSTALAALKSAFGFTGNLTNAPFTAAYDKLLDNLKVDVKPGGAVTLQSAAAVVAADAGAAPADPAMVRLAKGSLPAAADASALVAPTNAAAAPKLSDTEPLRKALADCFALSAASRGTSAAPFNGCAGIEAPNAAYKNGGKQIAHEFGATATTSFDGATVAPIEITRPLDANGDQLAVRLAIKKSDGSWLALNTVLRRYSNLATGSDTGYRLYGNQRNFAFDISAYVQRREFPGSTTQTRYETGLTVTIPYASNTTSSQVRYARIVGPGLPPNGMLLAKQAGTSPSDTLVWARPGGGTGTPNFATSTYCPGPSGTSQMITNPGATTVTAMTATSNIFRLQSFQEDGTATVPASSDYHYASKWNYTTGAYDASGAQPYVADATLGAIRPGAVYCIEAFLADSTGAVASTPQVYYQRLLSPPLKQAEVRAAPYPLLDDASKARFDAFRGGASTLALSWTLKGGPAPSRVKLLYNGQGDETATPLGPTQRSADARCPETSTERCQSSFYNSASKSLLLFNARTRNDLSIISSYQQH